MSKSLKDQETQTLSELMNARILPNNLPDLVQIIEEKARADAQLLEHSMVVLGQLGCTQTIGNATRLSSVTRLHFGGDPNAFDFEALGAANRRFYLPQEIHEIVRGCPEIIQTMKRNIK